MMANRVNKNRCDLFKISTAFKSIKICVCVFSYSLPIGSMKKEQEYIIKLNHEILDELKNKERLQTIF